MAKRKKSRNNTAEKPRQICPLGKIKVLEQRALEAYDNGDFVSFAATYDYFGLSHADEHALEIGRADSAAYNKKLSEIDMQYSGNIGISGSIKFKPFGFDVRR